MITTKTFCKADGLMFYSNGFLYDNDKTFCKADGLKFYNKDFLYDNDENFL